MKRITLNIETPSDEKLAVLRAIPRAGMPCSKVKRRGAYIDLMLDGLVRVDATGMSVHLTTVGLMCLEAIDELQEQEQEQEQNEPQTNGVAA